MVRQCAQTDDSLLLPMRETSWPSICANVIVIDAPDAPEKRLGSPSTHSTTGFSSQTSNLFGAGSVGVGQ